MLDSDILTTCVTQTIKKLPFGCFDVFNSNSCEMTHGEFKALSSSSEIDFDIETFEDTFWRQVTEERIYAINNPITLFGDGTKVWNLDKFTKDESKIHSKPSHRLLRVSEVFQE